MPLRAGTRPSLGKRKPSNHPIEFNIFNTYPINSLLNPINSLLNPINSLLIPIDPTALLLYFQKPGPLDDIVFLPFSYSL